MIRFFAGVVVGVVISSIGLTGVINILDNSVTKVKEVAKDAEKKNGL
jgi:hypothetical protein